MRASRLLTVGAFLSASMTSATLADSAWEVLARADGITPADIPGVTAVWVPNTFNNPTVDLNGRVCFRAQIAGPGITNTGATANHLLIVQGEPGAWSILARNNSGVPGNFPTDAVISRTASPNNSLVSANNITDDGGVIVSGYMVGPGITAGTNDTANWFVPGSGAPVLISQGRDICPGTAGAQYPANVTAGSGLRVNSVGQALVALTLSGGDTVTANNSAVVLIGPGDDQLVLRKGSAAPGLSGVNVNPDSFGLFLNGTKYVFSGTLVGTGVGTTNDKAYFTNTGPSGALRIFAREGDPIPGFKGLTFGGTSLSLGQRPLASDGTITFIATLGGTATSLNNGAVMTENNGVFSILLRKGDAIPGITDSANPDFNGKVFSSPNSTGNVRTRDGLYAFEGILMNADGSSIISPAPATFVGVRKPDGTVVTVCRQTDPVPGLAAGWVFDGLNGSTSICASDNGVVVFKANMSNAKLGESGSALCAWDEVGGLRVLAKATQLSVSPFTPTGDTIFTGTPCNQITLIGSTGNNGDGGGTGLSSTGWLAVSAGDTPAGIYAIARIKVGSESDPCPADISGNGTVGAEDLAALLGGWGGASPDLNGDGTVNATDLAALLTSWGACP
jgi:hypothetical protein